MPRWAAFTLCHSHQQQELPWGGGEEAALPKGSSSFRNLGESTCGRGAGPLQPEWSHEGRGPAPQSPGLARLCSVTWRQHPNTLPFFHAPDEHQATLSHLWPPQGPGQQPSSARGVQRHLQAHTHTHPLLAFTGGCPRAPATRPEMGNRQRQGYRARELQPTGRMVTPLHHTKARSLESQPTPHTLLPAWTLPSRGHHATHHPRDKDNIPLSPEPASRQPGPLPAR